MAGRSRIADRDRNIQGTPPAQLPALQLLPLPLTAIRPYLRIAHRLAGPITIPERIIFDYEFVVLLRGSGTLRLRGSDVALRSHQLLLLPPWLPHTFDCPVPGEHIAVHFDLSPEVPGTRLDRRPPYQVQLGPDQELPLLTTLQPADGIEDGFIQLVLDVAQGTAAGDFRAHARPGPAHRHGPARARRPARSLRQRAEPRPRQRTACARPWP